MTGIKNFKCDNCGGEVIDGVCRYCGSKDIKKSEREIISLLNNSEDMEEYYLKIRIKICSQEKLTEVEDKFFYLLLKEGLIRDECLDADMIIRAIALKNKIVSYDTFKEVMICYAKKIMRDYNAGRIEDYNLQVIITDLEEAGSTLDFYICYFNELIIKNLYEGFVSSLIAFFHEIRHIKQFMDYRLGDVSAASMFMLKDMLIRKYENHRYGTDYYYKDNYYNINFEIFAENLAITDTQKLLDSVGIIYSEDFYKKIRDVWSISNISSKRIIRENGEKVYKTLDERFLEVIKLAPYYLEQYRQLQIEYVNENGVVRKRTKMEMQELVSDNLNNKKKM